MKKQPAYNVCKRFYKAIHTAYNEPEMKGNVPFFGSPAELTFEMYLHSRI